MARVLTAGMITEYTAKTLSPIILIKAEFVSADLNLWSGRGDLVYAGDTYLGAGSFLTISEVIESVNLEANNVTFGLSGIPSSLISLALSEAYQGRFISQWAGCLDASGAIVADPYLQFKGRMDVIEIMDSGETSSISVRAESILIDFRRTKLRNFTDEDQKAIYSSDKGLQYVGQLQDKELIWGRADPKK